MNGIGSKPEPAHWQHAAEVVPLLTVGLFAAVALARALHVPWWGVPAAVLMTGVAALLAVAVITAAPAVTGYTAAAALTAAGWALAATLAGPWSAPAVLGLGVPALFLGILYPVARGHHQHAVSEARRRAEESRLLAGARKWPDLLGRLGAKGVSVADSAETRAGHTHRLLLPASGKVTHARLEKLTDGLEAAARLRHGALRFEEGEHAGEVLLHVAEKDILAQEIPYPGDLSDLTVNRPFRVGTYEDGSVCEVLYREVVILIVGLRGKGKSSLLNVLVSQLGRCVDVVTFMIDLKGGRAALPWIKPWMEGRSPRPVIDWVATTREEAERMLGALLRGVNARSSSGAGGEKIVPSPAQPAVALIMDEMAVIFGAHGSPRPGEGTTNSRLAGMGTQIVQLGRSEAIDAIMATQRGTVTMTGGGDLKSQCGTRIGLGVATEADARLIVPDDASVARILPRLKHPGSGIVSSDSHRLAPVKFDRLTPERIDAIAAELGERRPEPEQLLAAAFGEDYALRWTPDRAGHIPGFARAAARVGAGGGAPDGDGFDEIVAGLDDLEDAAPAHPARKRMHELLERAGVMGMTPAAIGGKLEAEGLSVARQTIQRWLKEDLAAGLVEQATFGRWKKIRGTQSGK